MSQCYLSNVGHTTTKQKTAYAKKQQQQQKNPILTYSLQRSDRVLWSAFYTSVPCADPKKKVPGIM